LISDDSIIGEIPTIKEILNLSGHLIVIFFLGHWGTCKEFAAIDDADVKEYVLLKEPFHPV
jgi:hypothetical protein